MDGGGVQPGRCSAVRLAVAQAPRRGRARDPRAQLRARDRAGPSRCRPVRAHARSGDRRPRWRPCPRGGRGAVGGSGSVAGNRHWRTSPMSHGRRRRSPGSGCAAAGTRVSRQASARSARHRGRLRNRRADRRASAARARSPVSPAIAIARPAACPPCSRLLRCMEVSSDGIAAALPGDAEARPEPIAGWQAPRARPERAFRGRAG